MKRLFILLTLAITAMTHLFASTDYTAGWKSVQQLIDKGNMTQARDKATTLFDAARKDKNSFQTLRGALMLQQIEGAFEENAFEKAIARYNAIEPEMKPADKALLRLYQSKMYDQYFDMNDWAIRRNPHLAEPTDDIAQWDREMFIDTIYALKYKALTDIDVLKKTKSATYAELLTSDDTSLRPTLYDIVMQEIITGSSFDGDDEQAQALFEDPALYGPTSEFCAMTLPENDKINLLCNLRMLQELTRFHAKDDAALRSSLDEQRLDLVASNSLHEPILLREGLERLTESYKLKDECAERAFWYYRQAVYWKGLNKDDEEFSPQHYVTAYDLAGKGLAIAPKGSKGAAMCKNLMTDLTQPSFNVKVSDPILPDEESKAIISHSNLTHIWFRIIKYNHERAYFDEETLKPLVKRPALHRWDTAVEDPHDYDMHQTPTTIPALDPGQDYLLMASSTPDFNLKGYIECVPLNVSLLAIYVDGDESKGMQTGIVVNRKTGQPVTDCDVSLWINRWNKGKYEDIKLDDIEVKEDGFFTIPQQKEHYSRMRLRASDGQSVCEQYINDISAWEFKYKVQCQLFTDRQSYRPGDEVQFSALVYEEADVNHFHVLPKKTVKVGMRDVNYQVVQEMEAVTDDFGCISGSFTLGESMLPGSINLFAEVEDENARTTHYINLEAYKQPTFAIQFERFPDNIALTDSVHVVGSAISYTAVPVQDARVSYRITRAEQPSWRWWNCYGREKTVARGFITTQADGSFVIDIPPMYTQENKRLKDRCYRYNISVEITAIDGETQSQSTSVRIGKPYESKDEEIRPDIMPEGALLWGYQPERTVELGEEMKLQWGTRQKDVCVVWFLERGIEVVDKGIWNISDEQREWTLPATEEWRGTYATLRLVTFHENETKMIAYRWNIPDNDRKLAVTLVTFRDRLTPGQPETWTLHIAGNDGTPARANLLTALYDASLDVYGSNYWGLYPWHTFSMDNMRGSGTSSSHSDGIAPEVEYQRYGGTLIPQLKYFNGVSFGRFRNRPMMLGYATKAAGNAVLEEVMVEKVVATDDEELFDIAADAAPVPSPEDVQEQEASAGAAENGGEAGPEVYIREDLRHTSFFMPCLRTDKQGNVDITFTAPDLLTEWHFQNLAFTEDLRVGSLTQSVITRKELMVQPNVPRFLRQGDSMAFTAKVSNVSEKEMDVRVRLLLTDARTEKPISTFTKEQEQTLHLAAGEVMAVSFSVTMPDEVFACTYRIIAEGFLDEPAPAPAKKAKGKGQKAQNERMAAYSDGEQGIIPVLTNRTLVTESLSMYANPGEKKTYTLESLKTNASSTLTHHKLALEYTSAPIWYAIQSLPALDEVSNPSNLQLFHRYFANSLTLGILHRYPQIEGVFKLWAEETPDAFLSNLEKNNDLKQIVLSETPWLLQAQSESADRRRLVDFFSNERAEETLNGVRRQILDRQNTDGGWSWMPDFESSTYITLSLLRGFGELQQEGCIDLDADTELAAAIRRAIDYVDTEYYKDYLEWKRLEAKYSTFWKTRTFTPICTNYLFTRSAWKDIPFNAKTKVSYDYFYSALKRVNHVDDGLMTKSLTALTFERNNDHALAAELIEQLKEIALTNDEMGMYWRDNTPGWCWYNAPVETQSMLIQAFYECAPDITIRTAPKPDNVQVANTESPCLPLMQQWLLKQKQTTRWDTDVATAHAVYALLLGGGSAQLDPDAPKAVLTAGGHTVQPAKQEAGSGYFRHDWEPAAITPALADITIDNTKNPSCSWGALYWQYFENMDKVMHSEQGFSVSAHYFKYLADGSISAIDGPLQVGDKVKVRLRFTVDRDLEYVQVKALRPACFEPLSTRSGRCWNGGLSYYLAVEDASASLYIDYMQKGDYTVEMDYYVTYPGEFLSGTVTLQCLYAPEFRATFAQPNVIVN